MGDICLFLTSSAAGQPAQGMQPGDARFLKSTPSPKTVAIAAAVFGRCHVMTASPDLLRDAGEYASFECRQRLKAVLAITYPRRYESIEQLVNTNSGSVLGIVSTQAVCFRRLGPVPGGPEQRRI